MKLLSILKNKVIFYLSTRYLTYALQFVTSLVIAAKLGPFYFGVWGFILLQLQYFQQCHFGIYNSFNVLYVQHRDDETKCKSYIANSLLLESYLAFLVIVVFCVYLISGGDFFGKYNADKYFVWVCIIAILQYYQGLIINIFRVKNLLNYVSICQSVIVVLNFVCIFFFQGECLIQMLLAGYVVGNALALVLACTSGILTIKGSVISRVYQVEILKKGIYLFLYNTCFYFIIISIRTIISSNYAVEDFGQFTFSFSLAHAVMLLLESLTFIIFPKVIGKLSSRNNDEVLQTIREYRSIYQTSAHGLIYLALCFFPFLISFFPKYDAALTSMNLVALTVLMDTSRSGYAELLIARSKERKLAVITIIALVLNCVLSLFEVKILQVRFSYVILASMVTYYFLALTLSIMGKKEIDGKSSFPAILFDVFPVRLLIPYLCALLLASFEVENFMFLPILLFIMLNYKECSTLFVLAKRILVNPEIVNL